MPDWSGNAIASTPTGDLITFGPGSDAWLPLVGATINLDYEANEAFYNNRFLRRKFFLRVLLI
ncbi:MAG: hypothetical protein NPIRA03_17170 [Nitrospirales bacterium]|nr:MAG: hypothetical protein NPIRA03_17170 [Nitrospirales bacterium]